MLLIHQHSFTNRHVPPDFPNKFLGYLKDHKSTYGLLKTILHIANPFTKKDSFDRLRQMIKEGDKSQRQILLDLFSNYPSDAVFVILTMDMNYMGAGSPTSSFIQQCYELDRLRISGKIIPFLHMDCRRGNMMGFFDEFVVEKGWGGVKLYPPLGVFVTDPRYDLMFQRLGELKKPIITHCTYGNPVHFVGSERELAQLLGDRYNEDDSRKENCNKFTDPYNYIPRLEANEDVFIDFAHSGGSEYMLKWLDGDRSESNPFIKIMNLCANYKNAFMDISYTAAEKRVIPLIKVLASDKRFKEKILFGSDYYMSLNECSEIEWAINIRASLGETIWNQMQENNRRFLGL